MDLRLLCTDIYSESITRLANQLSLDLGYKVYRSDRVVPNRQHIRYGDQRDKLVQYKFFRKNGLNFPWFSESKKEAEQAIFNDKSILCRVMLKGQEGHGIVIADTVDELVDAPVYVEYKHKTNEFRVNLFRGQVVNVREKKKLRAFVPPEEGYEPRIRNVANGYVYCLKDDALPLGVAATAIAASHVTDSDIVGVDIAYSTANKEHFLIEVNSAPAMEGVTVNAYAKFIENYFS